MRRLKSIILIAAALLPWAFASAGCSGGSFKIPQYEDNVRMDIGLFDAPVNYFTAQSYFDDIAEAGCNYVIPVYHFSVANTRQLLLDRCRAAGLKAIFVDRNLVSVKNITAEAFNENDDVWDVSEIDKYIDDPAFYGVHIMDEPLPEHFEYLKKKREQWNSSPLAQTDALFYVNLFPDCYDLFTTGISGKGTVDYKEYVREFMDTVKPGILSIDYYPIRQTAGQTYIWNNYFSCLDFAAHTAKEYNVPLKWIILTAGHGGADGYKSNLTVEDLRWQMAVVMTYGVKNLTHYNYYPIESHYNAMITEKGRRTQLFDYVAEANKEVLAWDHVFLNFNWQGTAAVTGSHGANNVMFDLIEDAMPVRLMNGIKSIESSEDVLFGYFKDGKGNNGYMLTNAANPDDPYFPQVTVQFDKSYKGLRIYEKGLPRTVALDKGKATISLDAGEGKFLIPLKKA